MSVALDFKTMLSAVLRGAAEAEIARVDEGMQIEAYSLARIPLDIVPHGLLLTEPLKRACNPETLNCLSLADVMITGMLVLSACEQVMHDELIACVEVEDGQYR